MTYEGEILDKCPVDLDFSNTWAVVVSGAAWNPCGHMLLCCGSNSEDSRYFHVAGQGVSEALGIYAYPKFMGEGDYYRYLRENGKHEIRRTSARISDSAGARQRLEEYLVNKWIWAVLPHNCAVFVREIIRAGGGDLSVLLNCPDQEAIRDAAERGLHVVDYWLTHQPDPGLPKW